MSPLNWRPRGVLPPDAADRLAEYGRMTYGLEQPTDFRLSTFLAKLQFSELQGAGERVVDELCELGEERGEWTLYGAEEAIRAYFPDRADGPRVRELRDARLAFLHTRGDVRDHLQDGERDRYAELFPRG